LSPGLGVVGPSAKAVVTPKKSSAKEQSRFMGKMIARNLLPPPRAATAWGAHRSRGVRGRMEHPWSIFEIHKHSDPFRGAKIFGGAVSGEIMRRQSGVRRFRNSVVRPPLHTRSLEPPRHELKCDGGAIARLCDRSGHTLHGRQRETRESFPTERSPRDPDARSRSTDWACVSRAWIFRPSGIRLPPWGGPRIDRHNIFAHRRRIQRLRLQAKMLSVIP